MFRYFTQQNRNVVDGYVYYSLLWLCYEYRASAIIVNTEKFAKYLGIEQEAFNTALSSLTKKHLIERKKWRWPIVKISLVNPPFRCYYPMERAEEPFTSNDGTAQFDPAYAIVFNEEAAKARIAGTYKPEQIVRQKGY